MSITLRQFKRSLVQSGLMTAEEASSVAKELCPGEPFRDAEELAAELVRRKRLTEFQAAALYHGKIKKLVFGNYVLLEKLGEGGMGAVYKAEHRLMERVVALKVLPAELAGDDTAVKRFRREVKAAARLSHPNIVTAHDADQDEADIFLVMEFVDGADLRQLARARGPLAVQDAANYILQAARGLQSAHSQKVIHRDIKPSNLLLDNSGAVRVLDLGLARFQESAEGAPESASTRLTLEGQMLGTVDYMSPEQAEDTHNADARSDVYSLGCTMFYLLTGQPPYRSETVADALLAHCQASIPCFADHGRDVPPELERVFQKMVAKDPADRYQSMGEVVEVLEAFLGVATPSTSVPTPSSPAEFVPRPAPAQGDAATAVYVSAPTRQSDSAAAAEQPSTVVLQAELDTDTSRVRETAPAPRRTMLLIGAAALAAMTLLAAILFLVCRG